MIDRFLPLKRRELAHIGHVHGVFFANLSTQLISNVY